MVEEVAGEVGEVKFVKANLQETFDAASELGVMAIPTLAGAILLEAGVETCRRCLLNWFDSRLAGLSENDDGKDPKTRLQEHLQGRGQGLPEYDLIDVSGEDHAQIFRVSCVIASPKLRTEGEGSSRRKAEQAAASAALECLADA